ncbi:hypothetical protein HPB48_012896 [Haemaphysalis longicornis]|uniref:Uncharacterized protein n=1 Tax=Haemaphysalis longicornis TaxID=44386 RepID=A0A9J6GFY8_HAELO|nr:hypothetical protein HPB48_012896 [Haemaphysalis longicornis]
MRAYTGEQKHFFFKLNRKWDHTCKLRGAHVRQPTKTCSQGGAWTDVTQRRKRAVAPTAPRAASAKSTLPATPQHTVILRPRERHCLSDYSPRDIHLGLTKALPLAISPGAYRIRILKASNTLAIDIWQPHVLDIFLGITKIGISTSTIPLQAYEALSGGQVRGVIYGIDPNDPEEELLHNLSCRTHWIVAARRMGKKTALITFESKRPPRYVLYYNCMMAVAPYTPKSVICNVCHDIGDKADICPNSQHPRCAKCGKEHADGISDCTGSSPQCENCGGSHVATDPRCKKRIEANKGIRARQARRRPFRGSTHIDESRIPPNKTMRQKGGRDSTPQNSTRQHSTSSTNLSASVPPESSQPQSTDPPPALKQPSNVTSRWKGRHEPPPRDSSVHYPPLPPNPSASVSPPEAPAAPPPSGVTAQDPALTSAPQLVNDRSNAKGIRQAQEPQSSPQGSRSTSISSAPPPVAQISQAEPCREIQQLRVDFTHQQSLLRQSILKEVRAIISFEIQTTIKTIIAEGIQKALVELLPQLLREALSGQSHLVAGT